MSELPRTDITQATLCFPIRGGEVLLGEKQNKIGKHRLNGFGGKMEPTDRDIDATNIRETEEEVGIRVVNPKKVGEIDFRNPSTDAELGSMVVHIYTATEWVGEPTESDEMKKIAWHRIDTINYNMFLSADRLFLPQILGGACVRGAIEYGEDWSVQTSHISEVEGF